MKRLLLLLTAVMGLSAAPIFTVAQPDLQGPAGSTVEWTFSLTPADLEFITITSSFPVYNTVAEIGFYQDVIGTLGGPVNFSLPPGSQPWTGTLGSYTINPASVVNDFSAGILYILYETYSADPTICGNCFTGSGMFTTPFSVTTTNDVPEPGTLWLLSTGLIAAGVLRRRRNK